MADSSRRPEGRARRERDDQLAVGHAQRRPGPAHAGRSPVPGGRHVAHEERRHARAQGTHLHGGRRDRLLRLRLRLRLRQRRHHRLDGLPAPGLRRSAEGLRDHGPVRRADRVEVALPVRVRLRDPRHRLGLDARADQVPRPRDLRRRVRRLRLPARLALGVRRRLAPDEHRHAGLRRLDRRSPGRRDGRARRPAHARSAPRQVRPRRREPADPRPQHVHPRPGHVHPAVRLVRLQRRLHARHHGRPLRRGRRWSPCSARPAASWGRTS